MKRILFSLVVCALLVAGCSTPKPPEVVSKVPGAKWDFKILKTTVSEDQTEATVAFAPRYGIFGFQLEPASPKLKKITLGFSKERYCEGLTFRAEEGAVEIDLLRVKGVNVSSAPEGLMIEVVPPALDMVRRGGRVMFVNEYR